MVKVPPSRATACCPGRLGRRASGLGSSTHSGGAPQPLRPQRQLIVRPSARAKVADSSGFDHLGPAHQPNREAPPVWLQWLPRRVYVQRHTRRVALWLYSLFFVVQLLWAVWSLVHNVAAVNALVDSLAARLDLLLTFVAPRLWANVVAIAAPLVAAANAALKYDSSTKLGTHNPNPNPTPTPSP